jgi:hypothetical protein
MRRSEEDLDMATENVGKTKSWDGIWRIINRVRKNDGELLDWEHIMKWCLLRISEDVLVKYKTDN